MADVTGFGPRDVYDPAAPGYAHESERSWPWCADRVVDLAAPGAGARVLDVACGPGTLGMRMGPRVGSRGHVLALDIAPGMVAVARERVRDLPQVAVELGDMHGLAAVGGGYDVVTMGFGLFFAHDVAAVAGDLWAAVRPGGRLVVSTVGVRFFAPMYEVFVRALLAERPAADTVVPWARTERAEQLEQLLRAGGVVDPQVTSEARPILLGGVEHWWRIVEATGIRRLAELVDGEQRSRVRDACARHIGEAGVDAVTLEAHFAVATKPE